jgi:REP element-mobilizing transposase RayT
MGFVMPSGLHRTYGAHHLHFITSSCYRRLPFLRTARSRDTFLAILEQTRERYRFVVVGYVVMPEHIHLLLTEPEVGSLSTVMQVVKQRTARALLPKRKRRNPRQSNLFGDEPNRRAFWQALLRLQRMDDEEARGEAPVHASESSETRLGRRTGGVAMEQLSILSFG